MNPPSPRARMDAVRYLILYYDSCGWDWTLAAAFLLTRGS